MELRGQQHLLRYRLLTHTYTQLGTLYYVLPNIIIQHSTVKTVDENHVKTLSLFIFIIVETKTTVNMTYNASWSI